MCKQSDKWEYLVWGRESGQGKLRNYRLRGGRETEKRDKNANKKQSAPEKCESLDKRGEWGDRERVSEGLLGHRFLSDKVVIN